MDIFIPVAAFALTFAAGYYFNLGLSLCVMLLFGYLNGVIRANYLGLWTTFQFDSAAMALYLVFLLKQGFRQWTRIWSTPFGRRLAAIIVWPLLLCLVPTNHPLVQISAARSIIWYLPVAVISFYLRPKDLRVFSAGLALLNLMALGFAVYIYFRGVEALFPVNHLTIGIYNCHDVGDGAYHRIPACFLNAQHYGASMAFSLPFMIDRLVSRWSSRFERILGGLGLLAAIAGVLLCAARTPFVMMVGGLMMLLLVGRFSARAVFGLLGVIVCLFIIANLDERLQRFNSLASTEFVVSRIGTSVNASFLDLLFQYPFGAGMGSAHGTPNPPLIDPSQMPEKIGMENEWSHILIDQGILGLVLWISFVVWLLRKVPQLAPENEWGVGIALMYCYIASMWAAAFVGLGFLASIPATSLNMIHTGVFARWRDALRPGWPPNKSNRTELPHALKGSAGGRSASVSGNLLYLP